MFIMDCDDDRIDDLLPKKATIGKRRRFKAKDKAKTKTKTKTTQKKITPALEAFKSVDPFVNPKEFVSFYRSIVRSYANDIINFPTHGADRQYASWSQGTRR